MIYVEVKSESEGSAGVELVSNYECDSFCVQVGSKVYLYDEDG